MKKSDAEIFSPWLVGKKMICRYCNLSWDSIRKYHRYYDLPIHRLPGSPVPMALPEELNAWIILVQDQVKYRRKE